MSDKARLGGLTSLAFHEQNRDAAVLRATTELFVNGESRSRDEIRRFEELATHFLGKVGPADRSFVSEALAACEDAPASVLRLLGKDLIEVAAPILSRAPGLTNLDYLMIIAATGPLHHRMLARRRDLPDDVADALSMSADAETAEILAARGARKAGTAPRREAATASLAARTEPDAPAPTTIDPLRPADFLSLGSAARLRVMAEISQRGVKAPPRPPQRSLERMLQAAVHTAQIPTLARKGEAEALARGFAETAGLDPFMIRRMIDDPSGEALVVLLKAARLEPADARTVLLLANPAIGTSVEAFYRLVDLFDALESDVADALTAAWRGENLVRVAGHQPHFSEAEGVRPAEAARLVRPASTIRLGRRKA